MADASLAGIQARAARNRAHNRWVVQKLVLFSVLMVVAPLATFFGVRSWIGPGVAYVDSWRFVRALTMEARSNATNGFRDSGFAAVLVVNVVAGGYVVSAWMEDDGEGSESTPAVGRFASAKSKQQ